MTGFLTKPVRLRDLGAVLAAQFRTPAEPDRVQLSEPSAAAATLPDES